MDVTQVPIVPHKQEDNGITKMLNGMIVIAVSTALGIEGMGWKYWTWKLADATYKYN